MSAVINLRGIHVFAHHGVLPAERVQGQEFVVDVACGVVTPRSDSITSTVDYTDLSRKIHDLVAEDPVNLLETVAARVADACVATENVLWADVTIHKPEVAMPVPVEDVSVTVSRGTR